MFLEFTRRAIPFLLWASFVLGVMGGPAKAATACSNNLSLQTVWTAGPTGYVCDLGIVTWTFFPVVPDTGKIRFIDNGLIATQISDSPQIYEYTLTQSIIYEDLNYSEVSEYSYWRYHLTVNPVISYGNAIIAPNAFMPTRSVSGTFSYDLVGTPNQDPITKNIDYWPGPIFDEIRNEWIPTFSLTSSPTAQGLSYGDASGLSGFDDELLRTDQILQSMRMDIQFSGGKSDELFLGATLLSAAPVPEPGTLAVALFALGALIVAGKRRHG